jgi:hypothetical protein
MAGYWRQEESRWGDRVKVHIPVRVSSDAAAGAGGHIKNVSLSGALVNSDVDLKLHSLVEVSIEMPSTPQREEAIMAYVSRKVHGGVGVEWCEFAPRAVKELLRSPSLPAPN